MFLLPSHPFLSRIKFSQKKPQTSSKYELEGLLSCSSSNQSSGEDHVPKTDSKILTSWEMNNSFSMWSPDWRPLVLLKFTTSEALLWRDFTWHKDSFVLVRESRWPLINNMASGWFSFSFSESISLLWILISTDICCVSFYDFQSLCFNWVKKNQLCEDSDWKLFEHVRSLILNGLPTPPYILTALSFKTGVNKMHFLPSLEYFVYVVTVDKNNPILTFLL